MCSSWKNIHFLTGKNRTQIELNFILENLLGVEKKVIFTSCHLPSDIPKINDKLKSRLCSSLISNIEAPDYATRLKILRVKAKTNGYEVDDEIIQYLASELTEDVRQLESGLAGVMAKASLLCAPLDLNLAGSVVQNMVQHRQNITLDAIKRLVCKQYRVSPDQLVSRSRKQAVVRPRQIAMYLARKYTDSTLHQIGKSFNRYHATAIHSVDLIERGIKENRQIQQQVEYLCRKLETGKY